MITLLTVAFATINTAYGIRALMKVLDGSRSFSDYLSIAMNFVALIVTILLLIK
jgi:hypothetical protein